MKEWNEFPHLHTSEELFDYFDDRAYTHGKYCHYTKISTIEQILKASSFRLSCVSGFNDECDKWQFGNEQKQKYFYSLCFSTGESENLALWYLYSGMNGQGGRIRFSSTRIKRIIKESTYTLYKLSKNRKKYIGKGFRLENGVTMRLQFQDVLYFQKQEKNVRLKYNTMVNNQISLENFQEFEQRNKGFLKNAIWYHEKETRLLIELKGKARDFIQENQYYAVEMKLPDSYKSTWMYIEFAPEINKQIFHDLVANNQYLREYQQKTSHLRTSQYAGLIKMNFCDKCKGKSCKCQ